jgi:sugar-specific transcriptional regulator TrmB
LLSLEENAEILSDFGLTYNQAKVYITIAKLGMASVGQVSKSSKVRREDVYRMLPKLEKKGLIEKILGKPARIRATPVEDALSLLIRQEQDFVNSRLSQLMDKKDAFLENFKAYEMNPTKKEGVHFALISQRDGIFNRGLNMIKNAEREIAVITSRYEFYQLFANYAELVRKAIKKGVKVRVILDVSERDELILRIIEEYKSSKAPFDLKYTYQPSSHLMIADYKQVLVATSPEPPIGQHPYLWTVNNNLVGLMQKYFENMWHASVNQQAVVTRDVSEQALHFVSQLRPTDHVIFLYESSEVKHDVLFNYLKVGLENGEAAVYVASEETPSEIREAMKAFGIEVEKNEKTGALRILDCHDFYIIDGKFDIETTMGLINKMHNEALAKGFKGWRITGEMACFFKHNSIQELIEYERALHRVFDTPIIGVCAYNTDMLTKVGNPINLYSELVTAHGTVLFTGIDNKLGRIEIRRA